MICSFFYLHVVFFQGVSPLSMSSSLDEKLACPGQKIYFLCNTNSRQLSWSSPELIGQPGVRIEFSGTLDDVGTVTQRGNAVGTLLGVNGSNVTSSELVTTASQDIPTATVMCICNNDPRLSVNITFEVPGTMYIKLYIVYTVNSGY